MAKIWILSQGDLYDYDAPAPIGVFSTREKALSEINSSISFREHPNGTIVWSADISDLYEFDLDTLSTQESVKHTSYSMWGYIVDSDSKSKQMMKDWHP